MMRPIAGAWMLTLLGLSAAGCADEAGPPRSSWDARPVASAADLREPAADETVVARSEPSAASWNSLPSTSNRRVSGPLPLGRPNPPAIDAPRGPIAPPAVVDVPLAAATMCPAYGNDAAAILAAQTFPVESARIAGGYQVSDGGTIVSFWRHTPLIVLGLQGQPVYCVAERERGRYRVPAGRRVCFADPDGDYLFDRVFIVQAEPKSYETAPVRYELNPLEAVRQAPSECHIRG